MSVFTWLSSATELGLHPRRAFGRMRMDGTNWPARLFLLINASLAGAIWAAVEALAFDRPMLSAWVVGMAVTDAVIVLGYIEAAGVRVFSRRRGWAVTFHRAERITSYASLGLLLAAVILVNVRLLIEILTLRGWLVGLVGEVGYLGPGGLLMLVLSLSVLGFEMLVWLGARRVRYANGPDAARY